MLVNGTGAAAQPQANSTTASKNMLNYDSFLRLLVAQMQNQDPTSPTDSSQYLSQLASFASVEQNVAMNEKLDAMMTALSLSQADSLIGQHVASADGTIQGIVKSVEINGSSSVATLDNGQRLALGDGIVLGSS